MDRSTVAALLLAPAFALAQPSAGSGDALEGAADHRIRVVDYQPDRVYRLTGYVGYQVDLEFESGETFVGLGAGDIRGLAFVAQGNHLFLKPRASRVETNLTVLTDRRHYHFDYEVTAAHPDPAAGNVIYAVRFSYPQNPAKPSEVRAAELDSRLASASAERARNSDYWFCGDRTLKPAAASDDGVHTRLSFPARAELPAVFVRADDGAESLLNFSMDGGDVVIHRVAPQYILRRGRLRACIVNRGFAGSGARLQTGTVSESVERVTPVARP